MTGVHPSDSVGDRVPGCRVGCMCKTDSGAAGLPTGKLKLLRVNTYSFYIPFMVLYGSRNLGFPSLRPLKMSNTRVTRDFTKGLKGKGIYLFLAGLSYSSGSCMILKGPAVQSSG